MNIYNMKSIFPDDFHIKNDEKGNYKQGDLKIRKVIKIDNIDNNWFIVGILSNKYIKTKSVKIKSINKLYKNGVLVNTHNLLIDDIYILHKKRLREKVGTIAIKDINKIKKISNKYLFECKEKSLFIKIIKNKKIYKLTLNEQKLWEREKQFSKSNKDKHFNIKKVILRNNLMEETQKKLNNDILSISKQLIFFTKKAKETIEKINLLNSKSFLDNKDKNLQKLYFEVSDEKEKLKIEVDVYKKQLNLYKLEREDKNEYIKKLKNKLKEIKEMNDIYKDKNNKNIKEKEFE
ncbi:hypothetical protein [Spiroplasma floricola]|uniref:Uncharacterized protein n=1 Tax=Spiroplasma floricola 23-6 TaxID=1336749 RepID=A0A2K8SEY0_9MOLU|nr:hypothetical protein [Spiroplasma floricola]AUB32009.1 hypothetical protein SFLOR_v1c09610 [Spiroplasma floricola 23-6]